ncbi:MAG TPA: winged helix-turn-helix domain-containing protein [Candidatus Paceibacterota bacterium]|nr:winged helix-turn-helix domain-containing protein [Candidatus Paceibacterota bacterium]
MPKDQGEYRRLERIVKGFASYRRLQVLDLLKQTPGLSIEGIAEKLGMGYMNASDHLRKMAIAGLLYKRSDGMNVRHTLTPRAESILAFCKKLK